MDRQNTGKRHTDLWLEAANWCRRVMLAITEGWNNLSLVGKATAIATFIGAVLGAIVGWTPAVNAWDDMGLPTAATRAWVRDDNGQIKNLVSTLNAKQRDMQIDNANGKIEAATSSRNAIEIASLKYDDEGKIKAQQEIRRLNEMIGALGEQKRAITGSRGPN